MSKLRRYPAIAVCALAATMGITLGNLLVPSLDQALGIGDLTIQSPVVAGPTATSPHPSGTGENDEAGLSEPAGEDAQHPDATEPGTPGSGTSGSGGAAGVDDDEHPSDGDPPANSDGTDGDPGNGSKDNGVPGSPTRPGVGSTSTPDGQTPADDEPGTSTTPTPGTPPSSLIPLNPTRPTASSTPTATPSRTPTPEPTETPDVPSFCLEIDLSPLELALCLLGGSSSSATPPTTKTPTPSPSRSETPRSTSTPAVGDDASTPDDSPGDSGEENLEVEAPDVQATTS